MRNARGIFFMFTIVSAVQPSDFLSLADQSSSLQSYQSGRVGKKSQSCSSLSSGSNRFRRKIINSAETKCSILRSLVRGETLGVGVGVQVRRKRPGRRNGRGGDEGEIEGEVNCPEIFNPAERPRDLSPLLARRVSNGRDKFPVGSMANRVKRFSRLVILCFHPVDRRLHLDDDDDDDDGDDDTLRLP